MSSAHGASPNGDGTELESVRALRKVNTKEHGVSKTRTYGALTWANARGNPVARQGKSTPSVDRQALCTYWIQVVAVVC